LNDQPPSDEGSRVTALRKTRIKAGWAEIKVWAASNDDAEKIRNFSEGLKMEALMKKMRQIAHDRNTPAAVVNSAMRAISNQDSPEYNTPSGATLTLITGLARTNQLKDLNAVVEMFHVFHPGNTRFVSKSVPTKVISSNVAHRLDFRSVERIMRWQATHPDWEKQIESALATFTLKEWTDQAVAEMEAIVLN
jgi:hypothetical protein